MSYVYYSFLHLSILTSSCISISMHSTVPGIRTYTEDVRTCTWAEPWCNEQITNTDFAAQWNANGHPHPKQDTLVLRWRDNSYVEYFFMDCNDSDNADQYDHQWWPGSNPLAGIVEGLNVHNLEWHYEGRLKMVPNHHRGPLLEYASVANCVYEESEADAAYCMANYNTKESSIPGVGPSWAPIAFMNKLTDWGMGMEDSDKLYVVANDDDPNSRKCIISFKGSDTLDLVNFLGGNNSGTTGYCGRHGVQIGVRNELWAITHDDQYQNVIKPALETCHEVTCAGHSLGGSLCDLFTMCANQGPEFLNRKSDAGMWDDYNSLIWNQPAV